jgi:NADH-quinone oxidoreductase subunit G
MRVWFLKETKSICTGCATGCNTIIGTRQDVIYRQTPRENDSVNSAWMCDRGRLDFHFVNSEDRLKRPQIREESGFKESSWSEALARAAAELKRFEKDQVAVIASARMTNEELWLTKRLIRGLDTSYFDVVPRLDVADQLLVSADRNPNTHGAQLFQVAGSEPGSKLTEIADKIRSGEIKAVVALGEDLARLGLGRPDLRKLTSLIVMSILPNEMTSCATVLLPSYAFAEKRGSMINAKKRLQRLNRAVRGPGEARDDWEILRDLIQQLTGSSGIYLIEDVFKQMAEAIPELHGLSLSKISDMGVQLAEQTAEIPVATL